MQSGNIRAAAHKQLEWATVRTPGGMAAAGTDDALGVTLYNAAEAGNVADVSRLLGAGASLQWTNNDYVSKRRLQDGKQELLAGTGSSGIRKRSAASIT